MYIMQTPIKHIRDITMTLWSLFFSRATYKHHTDKIIKILFSFSFLTIIRWLKQAQAQPQVQTQAQ